MEKEYFSHDYNTRSDKKIKPLLAKHGYHGYGLFWAIIEDLYNNANALQTDYESIAFDLRTTPDVVESIINDFGLFEVEDGFFRSLSVERRLTKREEKSIKARESAKVKWDKYRRNANAEQTQSDSNAIKEKNSKVKKRIVNNNKDKEREIGEVAQSAPTPPPIPVVEDESFKKFKEWLSTSAPTVTKLKEPFTQEQFLKLKEKCTPQQIMDLCLQMHNWKDLLKKRTSAYLTFTNWYNRDAK